MNKKYEQETKHQNSSGMEESSFVLENKTDSHLKELDELYPLFREIRQKPPKPGMAQWEKQRTRLMKKITESRSKSLQTIKDKLTTTDSVVCKLVFYFAILLAAALIAASAWFIYQEISLQTAALDFIRTFSC